MSIPIPPELLIRIRALEEENERRHSIEIPFADPSNACFNGSFELSGPIALTNNAQLAYTAAAPGWGHSKTAAGDSCSCTLSGATVDTAWGGFTAAGCNKVGTTGDYMVNQWFAAETFRTFWNRTITIGFRVFPASVGQVRLAYNLGAGNLFGPSNVGSGAWETIYLTLINPNPTSWFMLGMQYVPGNQGVCYLDNAFVVDGPRPPRSPLYIPTNAGDPAAGAMGASAPKCIKTMTNLVFQTVPFNVVTIMAFNVVGIDTDRMGDTGNRITIHTPGRYIVGTMGLSDNAAAGSYFYLAPTLNGGSMWARGGLGGAAYPLTAAYTPGGAYVAPQAWAVEDLIAGDYIESTCYVSQGGVGVRFHYVDSFLGAWRIGD
jgi:hypothetical protein